MQFTKFSLLELTYLQAKLTQFMQGIGFLQNIEILKFMQISSEKDIS